MNIIVNDQQRSIADNAHILDLLKDLDLPQTRVAVEVNKILVRRAEHENYTLKENDTVEIVTLVGGG